MRISPSQLDKFRECEERWHYAYIEKLELPGPKKMFEKGTYTHELMHHYYQLLRTGNFEPGSEFVQAAMRSHIMNDTVTSENVEIMSVVLPLLTRYVSQQSPKIDKDIEILEVEFEFFIPWGNIELHGFIDLVYRDSQGRIWIRDHKSSEKENSWRQEHLLMDGQLFFYALAMSIHFGEPVLNVEINFLNTYPYKQTQPLDKLFKTFKHGHTQQAIDAFAENVQKIHSRMELDGREKAYGHQCRYCPFKELCHLGGRGINIQSLIDGKFKKPTENKPLLLDMSIEIL